MSAIELGTVVGNGYTLKNRMGTTSLGELYLATNSAGEEVRVELLSGENAGDPEKVQRLLHEIELIASMDHPNVTKATDAGQDGDTYYLVTVHEPGKSLDQYIESVGGKLSERDAMIVAVGIASALNYAWTERKILHRDIKPSSIFITDDGTAKLLGFGIAKSTDSPESMGLTGAGFTIGTPEYMSPEQIRAEADLDFRSDLYALGCVLYQMIAGRIPFDDSAPILIMHKHMDEDPEPIPGISDEVQALIAKMLAKDRAERHDSWGELITEMKQLASGASSAVSSGDAEAAPEEVSETDSESSTAPEPTARPEAISAEATTSIQGAPPKTKAGGGNLAGILAVIGVIIIIVVVAVLIGKL